MQISFTNRAPETSLEALGPTDPTSRQAGRHAAIHLERLTKKYGSQIATDGIDLEIYDAEFVTLLGPSGSGKTTTLMMVAGHETPTHGRVLINGQDVTDQPAHLRRIGMVFQHFAIFPHMTVAENIAFPLRMRRMRKPEIAAAVASAIELVRLHGLDDRYSNQLSGGQLQRVALARALVFNPSILLMDEPLSALDKQLRGSMQIEIRRLQQQLGIPTLYVTHDQHEALVLSDRVAVFNNGRIVQIGTPAELYERPRSRFVAEFIGESNLFVGVVSALAGEICRATADQGLVVSAYVDRPFQAGQDVVIGVRPEAVEIVDQVTDSETNSAAGRVEQIVYSGNSRRITVRVTNSLSLLVDQRNSGTQAPVQVGQRVTLTWKWTKTNIMRKEEETP